MPELDIDLSCEDGATPALDEGELLATARLVLREEGIDRPCRLSLSVVGDGRMRELNRSWRGVDRVTDVLSLECERPDDPDLAPGEPCELGDVVLAPSHIARQAAHFQTTPADETRLLLVHGLLHLLGYDHLVDEEAAAMEAREDALVSLLATDADRAGARVTRHEGDGA
ncbi:MAG: rRNA maturation RNase YbeY [Acidobacteriota bacterium]|nr:rRNA maturation RNase YbeY [Acidobacteriota bacterium]